MATVRACSSGAAALVLALLVQAVAAAPVACTCNGTTLLSKCVDQWAAQKGCSTASFTATDALQGTIPSAIGSLVSVTTLNIHDSALTGTVPPSLGSLGGGAARQITLVSGQLTGTLPVSLLPSKTLRYLNIESHQLSGPLPDTWFNGPSPLLNILTLNGQRLSGTIPNQLSAAALPKLTKINLAANVLSGTVPSALGSLTGIQQFALYNNVLSGSIPPTLGSLKQARFFFIGDNMLSGAWPEYVCDMPLAQSTGSACSLQPAMLQCPMPTNCADYATRCSLECQYEGSSFNQSVPPGLP